MQQLIARWSLVGGGMLAGRKAQRTMRAAGAAGTADRGEEGAAWVRYKGQYQY